MTKPQLLWLGFYFICQSVIVLFLRLLMTSIKSVTCRCLRAESLQVWFRWMTQQNLILANPAADLELPRLGGSVSGPETRVGAKCWSR